MRHLIRNRWADQDEQNTSFPIQEAEGQPRGTVGIIYLDCTTLGPIDTLPKARRPGQSCSLRKPENLRNTVGSGLLGPLVNRPSPWLGVTVTASRRPEFDASFEFYLDRSYMFVGCIIPGSGIVVVCARRVIKWVATETGPPTNLWYPRGRKRRAGRGHPHEPRHVLHSS